MRLALFRIVSLLSTWEFFLGLDFYLSLICKNHCLLKTYSLPLVNYEFMLFHLELLPVLTSLYIAGGATIYSARTFKIKEDEGLR